MIGIFPAPMDRQLIPSAIATRVYVTLKENDWASKVAAGVVGAQAVQQQVSVPQNFNHRVHQAANGPVLEVWPRSGVWHPFFYAVPELETDLIQKITYSPNGILSDALIHSFGNFSSGNGTEKYKGKTMDQTIDPTISAFIYFSTVPTMIGFGQPNTRDKIFNLRFGSGSV